MTDGYFRPISCQIKHQAYSFLFEHENHAQYKRLPARKCKGAGRAEANKFDPTDRGRITTSPSFLPRPTKTGKMENSRLKGRWGFAVGINPSGNNTMQVATDADA